MRSVVPVEHLCRVQRRAGVAPRAYLRRLRRDLRIRDAFCAGARNTLAVWLLILPSSSVIVC